MSFLLLVLVTFGFLLLASDGNAPVAALGTLLELGVLGLILLAGWVTGWRS